MPTLLFLPGLACDATMWRAQLEAFADLRPAVASYGDHESMEAMAAGVLARHAGPLVLCGASMGGMVAMEAARQQPERIAGLALLGTSAAPDTDAMRRLREDAIVQFRQGRVREIVEPNVAFAFHPDHAKDKALVRSYLDFVLDAGADCLIRHNRAVIDRPDARLHLPRVRCPVLVMCGDSDALAPLGCSQEIADLVPQARLAVVPHCGHMLTLERPEAVNAALRDWLAPLFAA
jgi:pimeloyl-ACP methyl ester carboxylesterase